MPILEVTDLKKYFHTHRRRDKSSSTIKALDGVSLKMEAGQIHSIVGESGSGKTTLGRIIAGLIEPTEGSVILDGTNIFESAKSDLRSVRRNVQIIFQDPYSSLNPRFSVRQIVEEPLKLNKIPFTMKDIGSALMKVGLTPPEEFLDRYPHELSGGQRQRVAIARSIVVRPKFIVADEPVSMLDASMRASFLQLISDLRRSDNITMLMISHDISTAYYVSDVISVLYLGKIVETGSADEIIKNPKHPYTRALIQAVPTLGRIEQKKIEIRDSIEKSHTTVGGCRFRERCLYAISRCSEEDPDLRDIGNGHRLACHVDL